MSGMEQTMRRDAASTPTSGEHANVARMSNLDRLHVGDRR
jgi:hypothetical protein